MWLKIRAPACQCRAGAPVRVRGERRRGERLVTVTSRLTARRENHSASSGRRPSLKRGSCPGQLRQRVARGEGVGVGRDYRLAAGFGRRRLDREVASERRSRLRHGRSTDAEPGGAAIREATTCQRDDKGERKSNRVITSRRSQLLRRGCDRGRRKTAAGRSGLDERRSLLDENVGGCARRVIFAPAHPHTGQADCRASPPGGGTTTKLVRRGRRHASRVTVNET